MDTTDSRTAGATPADVDSTIMLQPLNDCSGT